MTEYEKPKKRKARFIRPPNNFKKKVGSGGFDNKVIGKSQQYLDTVEIDFIPYAQKYLEKFMAAVQEASKHPENFKEHHDKVTTPIMQMKANGGMFKYPRLTEVADSGLQFLETIDPENINSETFDVLQVHGNTLKIIIEGKLRDDGGAKGAALVQELESVCKRYYNKYKKIGI